MTPDVFTCATCDVTIAHHPVFHLGLAFCCAGCAADGPCMCSYDAAPVAAVVPEPAVAAIARPAALAAAPAAPARVAQPAAPVAEPQRRRVAVGAGAGALAPAARR